MNTSPKLVVANWKSNLNWHEAQEWAKAFSQHKKHPHTYVVCPPTPLLGALQAGVNSDFLLGVQDLSPFESGAYTGAVSAPNLSGLNVSYVLLGHSERRKYFGETSQTVAQKAEVALAHNLTPIICVDAEDFSHQHSALSHLDASKIVWAYEPVHAISTFGGQEDPIEVTIKNIAKLRDLTGATKIIYGGSISPENSLAYLQAPEIDGVLVGAKSLQPELFAQL